MKNPKKIKLKFLPEEIWQAWANIFDKKPGESRGSDIRIVRQFLKKKLRIK